MKRGERQTLKTNSGRQRLNLHGAIHAETHEVTVIESDAVNTDSTLRLIETLDQNYFLAQEILLIADNAKYHYSKAVQEALKDYPSSRVRSLLLEWLLARSLTTSAYRAVGLTRRVAVDNDGATSACLAVLDLFFIIVIAFLDKTNIAECLLTLCFGESTIDQLA